MKWYDVPEIDVYDDTLIEYKGHLINAVHIEDGLDNEYRMFDKWRTFESYVRDNAVDYIERLFVHFDVYTAYCALPDAFEQLRDDLWEHWKEDEKYAPCPSDEDVLEYFDGVQFVIEDFWI